MPFCSVKVPFGEEIIADLDVEYEIIDDAVDELTLDVTCCGFYAGRNECRQYIAFNAKAGPEADLRDRFVDSALAMWEGRIHDECQRHAEDNRLVNQFARGE